jgi:ubiquinone/menaquinone biosynthesis C-methylase UbiE
MLAHRIGSQLPRGSTVLEVAPGPGYFCIELAKLGPYPITGLDISHTFLEMAAKKAAEAGVQVDFRQGTASKMPFASNVFDFLRCRAAFKNFAEPVRALEEMCRVLKPGGRGLIIELRHDASPESINRHMDGMGLSAVNRLLTKLASGPCCSSPPIPRSSFSTCCRRPQNHQPLATSHGGQRPPYFPGPDFATIPAVSSIVRN